MKQETYLKKLYAQRFNPQQRKAKVTLWKVLIRDFLQKHIGKESDVLDIGGGYCEFINHIQAKEKYLIDLNPDSKPAFLTPKAIGKAKNPTASRFEPDVRSVTEHDSVW